MSDILTEFGARMEDSAPERVRHIPPPSLAYGIPHGRRAVLHLRAGAARAPVGTAQGQRHGAAGRVAPF